MNAAEKFADNSKVAFTAIDCTVAQVSCQALEVKGYPTFEYFNYGKNDQKYTGGREEADFVNFMNDPMNAFSSAPPPQAPDAREQWAGEDGAEHVQHLTSSTAESWLAAHDKVLVMFYAPWCGHCKNMKPAYAEAAKILADNKNVDGYLAAVDATVEKAFAEKYEIKGFPTLKLFTKGVFQMDYDRARQTNDMLGFMKNPKAAEAPVPEAPWSDVVSNVQHLTMTTFQSFLDTHDYVLVMFYAPWCGHCKSAKPHYQDAAAEIKGSTDRYLAAIDCTQAMDVCKNEGTKGYPTFYLYYQGIKYDDYNQGRTSEQFLFYIRNPPALPKPADDKPESQEIPKKDVKQEL